MVWPKPHQRTVLLKTHRTGWPLASGFVAKYRLRQKLVGFAELSYDSLNYDDDFSGRTVSISFSTFLLSAGINFEL